MAKILTQKSAALALALATLGSAAFATGAEARPRHYWGYGAAAVAGGIVLGSVLAASSARSAPVYVDEEEAPRRCQTVERVNRFGEVIGYRRVCRSIY
jgi:hypothetical protein